MPGWLVAVIIVVVVALAVLALAAMFMRRRREQRSAELRGRFGPEYDRTLQRADGRKEAERDLERRAEQREKLDIRPLAPAARERYAARWQQAQTLFVDDPAASIRDADRLVREVMEERGYPVHDFDRRAEDLSVDHPHLVDNFRGASSIAHRSSRERISTEEQRQAMVHFRALFDELLGGEAAGPGAPAAAEQGVPPTEGAPAQPVERARPVGDAAERTVGERPR